jgi:transcriptional regulator with XRE-family HTH domain
MNGFQLTQIRLLKGLEQQEAAEMLGISQSYLSLLENNQRKLSLKLAEKVVKVFKLSPEYLPFSENWEDLRKLNNWELAESVAAVGYPRFSHLKREQPTNPAQILFCAFQNENIDSRIFESLPWVVFTFPKLDWVKLTQYAKLHDFQNRLGFVVNLARQIAEKAGDIAKSEFLSDIEHNLAKSRLIKEDAMANLTEAEKSYLKTNRSKEAKYWRILSDLSINHLDYV